MKFKNDSGKDDRIQVASKVLMQYLKHLQNFPELSAAVMI